MAEEQRREAVIEFPQVRLTAGGRLRSAREAAGRTLPEMASETKIPVRMLTLIEAGDYGALPAKAYATGFSRSYARALGLNEQDIVAEVRRDLGHVEPGEARLASAFEPGDPARVPTARFAWLAAVAALAVLAAGLLLWRSYYAPAVTLPPLPEAPAPAAAAPAQVALPSATAASQAAIPGAAIANPPAAAVVLTQPSPRHPAAAPAPSTAAGAAVMPAATSSSPAEPSPAASTAQF